MEDRIAAIGATGCDPYQARLIADKPPPVVVSAIPAEEARETLRLLHDAGVHSFAPTASDLRSLPVPAGAKRVISGHRPNVFMIEQWQGDAVPVDMNDARLIVKAEIREAGLGPARTEVEFNVSPRGGITTTEFEVRSKRTKLTHVIDIVFADASRVRVNSAKFNFDVLGRQRGYSDLENIEKLALLLATSAPHAAIDTEFGQVRVAPMPGAVAKGLRLRNPAGHPGVDPMFDFYSAWSVYRVFAPGPR